MSTAGQVRTSFNLFNSCQLFKHNQMFSITDPEHDCQTFYKSFRVWIIEKLNSDNSHFHFDVSFPKNPKIIQSISYFSDFGGI